MKTHERLVPKAKSINEIGVIKYRIHYTIQYTSQETSGNTKLIYFPLIKYSVSHPNILIFSTDFRFEIIFFLTVGMFGATAVRQKREREKRDKIARGLKVTA